MQIKSPKKLYTVELEYANGLTRNVQVKASTRESAETRALKFNPSAKGVKRA